MESGGQQGTYEGTGSVYRRVVREELGEGLAATFERMEMETRGGVTILTRIIDQAQFHSTINRTRSLELNQ